jgi:hypothetical protein
MSSLQQDCRKGKNRFCMEVRRVGRRRRGWGAEITQIMYAHINKRKK